MVPGTIRVQGNSRAVTEVTRGGTTQATVCLLASFPFPQWRRLPLPCVSSAGSFAAPQRCDIVPGPEEGPRGPVKPRVTGKLASSPDTLRHTHALGLTLGRQHTLPTGTRNAQPSPVQAWPPSRLLQASSLLALGIPRERSLGSAANKLPNLMHQLFGRSRP